MTAGKDCSQVCVTAHTRIVYRVFLLEEGVWIPVSPGFVSTQEAERFAEPIVCRHGAEVLYAIRLCKMYLH